MTDQMTDDLTSIAATGPTRRIVLAGVVGTGAAVALAACGAEDEPTAGSSAPPETAAETPAETAAESPEPAETEAPAETPAADGLGATSEVPVGSAKIFAESAVVVTQATAGEFKGFDTKCPHMGCAVAAVEGDTIRCPCHGSTFGLDGARTGGPATTGLSEKAVTVSGDQIVLA